MRNNFQGTRWEKYWKTNSKSGNRSPHIEKSTMSAEDWEIYHVRELLNQAVTVLDQQKLDVNLVKVLVSGAVDLLKKY